MIIFPAKQCCSSQLDKLLVDGDGGDGPVLNGKGKNWKNHDFKIFMFVKRFKTTPGDKLVGI